MSKDGKTTLKRVAALAGVSPASASMILNQRSGVSFAAETVARVRLAAESLGYARAGAPAASGIFEKKVIAIFLPAVGGSYYVSMVQAINQVANLHGYDTVCFETHRNTERELRGLTYLGRSDAAGILFTFIPHNIELVERIEQTLPVVLIGNRNPVTRLDMVETDNLRAGELLARHMLDLGHRHVAALATTREWWGYASAQRVVGIEETFARECPEARLTIHQIPAGDTLSPQQVPSRRIGAMLTERALEDRRVTGLIAINDFLAYGALDELARRGMRVPEDISVCGCDDGFASSLPGVNLTSVNHHIREKATHAFELLNRKIQKRLSSEAQDEDESPASITRVEFLSTLMARGSTGAPPSKPRA